VNNKNVNIYSVVVMARPLQEFAWFIRYMEIEHRSASQPSDRANRVGCESACRLLPTTPTIAIYYYCTAWRRILILLSHRVNLQVAGYILRWLVYPPIDGRPSKY